jgi:NTP pyrophosphatase (non-canonical NTP hydrolase)
MNITHEEYAKNVAARCSNQFHGELVNFIGAAQVTANACREIVAVDMLKKALFYGKPVDLDTKPQEHMAMIWNTAIGDMKEFRPLFHAVLGIMTESAELVEGFTLGFSKGDFDTVNLKEELGDVLWYIQLACNTLGTSIPELMTINDKKLEKRFGPVFSEDKANNRDLDAERKTLEGE